MIKLTDEVYIVGGGRNGVGISDDYDSLVYLVDGGEEAALIDAGSGRDNECILANIDKTGISREKIRHLFLTHFHADHAGGAGGLREVLGLKVYISRLEAGALRTADEHLLGLDFARADGVYPCDYHIKPSAIDVELSGGEKFSIGTLLLTAIHIPGHSPGSTCYLLQGEKRRYLFSGDVLFFGGEIGLLNCIGSSLSDYRENIGRLEGLEVDALLPGHRAFCLSGAQRHINIALEAFKHIYPPKNLF